jgi:uncharacterized protein YndB with AHSA1/START domain
VTDTNIIHVERRIAAPPGAVFRYLTRSDLWARWQGEAADLDPRPGGRFQVRMRNGDIAEGTFLVVEPDARVVISWGWRAHPRMPPGTTTVDLQLVPDGDGTIVHLTHRGLPPEDLPIHRAGWDTFVARLEIAATGGDPGPSPA